jgi:hypothetical protein
MPGERKRLPSFANSADIGKPASPSAWITKYIAICKIALGVVGVAAVGRKVLA